MSAYGRKSRIVTGYAASDARSTIARRFARSTGSDMSDMSDNQEFRGSGSSSPGPPPSPGLCGFVRPIDERGELDVPEAHDGGGFGVADLAPAPIAPLVELDVERVFRRQRGGGVVDEKLPPAKKIGRRRKTGRRGPSIRRRKSDALAELRADRDLHAQRGRGQLQPTPAQGQHQERRRERRDRRRGPHGFAPGRGGRPY